MKLDDLIPKDKHDHETAEKLFNYSYEEIKPIVPALLEWLQDRNWPVSEPVQRYLRSISEHITDEILAVFETEDGTWKYWLIYAFIDQDEKAVDQRIIDRVKQVASHPTKDEKSEEADEVAREVLERRGYL